MAITAGRALAIPIASKYPVHKQLKVLTGFSVGVMALSVLLLWVNLSIVAVFLGSLLFGFGLSAMYPLMMTTPGAFNYKLSEENTALFTFCSALGESIIPILGGLLM